MSCLMVIILVLEYTYIGSEVTKKQYLQVLKALKSCPLEQCAWVSETAPLCVIDFQ